MYAQLVPRVPFIPALQITPIVGGVAVILFQVIYSGKHMFSPGLGGLIEEVSLLCFMVILKAQVLCFSSFIIGLQKQLYQSNGANCYFKCYYTTIGY